jgi:hypothetical protein
MKTKIGNAKGLSFNLNETLVRDSKRLKVKAGVRAGWPSKYTGPA